ncbi:zinc finger protein 888-like [Uranotaenia lowii]|uniref:zinc finger protein 888-like n=1 Tax=Uranotaenia lowii TaxID=190385 RepID=UPI00247936EC|nr:zinc finger protein 888-like [Uranotaenia lowii]
MDATAVATLLEIPSNDPTSYCRLCLSGALVEPLYLNEPRPNVIDLIAKNVQVLLADEQDFPCAVCQNCRFKLEDFERFRDQCQKLDQFVRTRRRELAILQEAISAQQLEAANSLVAAEEIAIKADPEALLGDDDSLPYVLTDDSWHRCKFCSEAFQSLSVLLEHFRMRHPDESKLYKCPHCAQSYAAIEAANTTCNPAYKCDSCDAGFSHRVGLARHKERYHDKTSPNYTTERFKCDHCPMLFVDMKHRSRHQLQTHMGCPTSGSSKSSAQVDGIHVCEKCAVTFSPYQALLVHIQEHHWNDPPEDTFSCSVCSKSFDKRRLLQYHILVAHLGQIPYACNHCGEWFRTKSHLKQHKTMFHERPIAGPGDASRCEYCGQTMEENDEMKDNVQ